MATIVALGRSASRWDSKDGYRRTVSRTGPSRPCASSRMTRMTRRVDFETLQRSTPPERNDPSRPPRMPCTVINNNTKSWRPFECDLRGLTLNRLQTIAGDQW